MFRAHDARVRIACTPRLPGAAGSADICEADFKVRMSVCVVSWPTLSLVRRHVGF
jgi:hypothetical protein